MTIFQLVHELPGEDHRLDGRGRSSVSADGQHGVCHGLQFAAW